MTFKAGQRWFSQTEPELGLGLIESVSGRRIQILFPATGETRVYAEDKAPLQRHVLKPGQLLVTRDGEQATVAGSDEQQGILIYQVERPDGGLEPIPEMLLAPELNLNSAESRLLSAQVNHLHWYLLRRRFREQYAEYQRQPARGLLGGRLQLNPHQYYIAATATRTGPPRLLLSDEVGLGKTIEAGLILHRLLVTGQASRALIIVPDHLLHQWLVELIRKFDLHCPIFDPSRLSALAEEDPDSNPFLSTQLALTPYSLWHQPGCTELALDAGWDCLVVDEAHHLDLNPYTATPTAQTVRHLAAATAGVLLLTATPEQDGTAGHFARLHVLDPERFSDYDQFEQDNRLLAELGTALDSFLASVEEGAPNPELLSKWCTDQEARQRLQQVSTAENDSVQDAAIEALVAHLIDIRGTGRLQFRNSRRRIDDFPQRCLHRHMLEAPPEYDPLAPWPEASVTDWTREDPRIDWLLALLRGQLSGHERPAKALVICHLQSTAIALEQHLRLREGVLTSLFHEDMDLMERDRAAAWFAQSETGAQVMICSEIGSEGRNFQFAHTLVCFDLPPHPDQLEQRIGRLDRIGQNHAINIHVPVLEDLLQAQWFRWYDEALDAFTRTCDIGDRVLRQVAADEGVSLLPDQSPALTDLAPVTGEALDARLQLSRRLAEEARQQADEGRNRLLEWHSFRREEAQELVDDIARFESAQSPENIVLELLDHLGIETSDEGQGLYHLQPGERVIPETLPEMIESGCLITFRRSVAVSRDDVRFVTWEHELIDFLLETLEQTWLGSAGVTLIKVRSLPKGSLYLETAWRPLLQHPKAIQASRFLPEGLFRCVVDTQGQDVTQPFTQIDLRDLEQRLDKSTLVAILRTQETVIEELVRTARTLAAPRLESERQQATQAAAGHYDHELARLQTLHERNGSAEGQLLRHLEQEKQDVLAAIAQADLHLDSLRLIVSG